MAARLTKLFFKKSQPCNVVIRYTCLAVHKIIRSEIKILIQNKQQFLHIFLNILARSSYICSFNPNSEIWGVLGRKKQIWMENQCKNTHDFSSSIRLQQWRTEVYATNVSCVKYFCTTMRFKCNYFISVGFFLFIWHTSRKFRICWTFFF